MQRSRLNRKLLIGKILIHPTESCFGIGCHPKKIKSLKKILLLKQRAKNKSFLLISDDAQKFKQYINNDYYKSNSYKNWKPHTSLLFKKKFIPKNFLLAPKQMKIGCRIPDHKKIKSILKNFMFPITSTSANLSGKKNLKVWRDCCRLFHSNSCIIIKDQIGNYSKPSQIIDFDTNKVIRK